MGDKLGVRLWGKMQTKGIDWDTANDKRQSRGLGTRDLVRTNYILHRVQSKIKTEPLVQRVLKNFKKVHRA